MLEGNLMNLSIGLRTIKTVIGVALAVSIAQFLGMNNYASAGMLAILSIQSTKKQSLVTARNRFIGSIFMMALCLLFFEGVAFNPLLIGCVLLIYIPLAVYWNVTDSIVPSSVVALHLYSYGYINLSVVLNEISIIAIGMTVALLLNLFMPSLDRVLESNKLEIEEKFTKIFKEIVKYLNNNDTEWSGIELIETEKLIKKSKKLAIVEQENNLFQKKDSYYAYFQLRDKQLAIIERVLPYVTSISTKVEQSKLIAKFIDEMSDHINSANTVDIRLQSLNDLRANFQEMDLPKTREEFEIRAALFYFVQEMEQFLLIKKHFFEVKKEE